ncbi:MAG: hypothetical protein KIT83_14025 [Bryobacterales bacterium]|nr:hypothetical protein [Bryobacterales bacterium]
MAPRKYLRNCAAMRETGNHQCPVPEADQLRSRALLLRRHRLLLLALTMVASASLKVSTA